MLSNRYDNQLTDIFESLTRDEDIIEITGWFCIAQWIECQARDTLVDRSSLKCYLEYDEFLESTFYSLGLNQYPASDFRYILSDLINAFRWKNLIGANAVRFFERFLCSSVTDSSFLSLESNESQYGGAIICSLIYLCLLNAGEKLGDPVVLTINPSDIYWKYADFMKRFAVSEAAFERCWNAVHCVQIPSTHKFLKKVLDAAKTYAKYEAPKTLLLDQYAAIKGLKLKRDRITPSLMSYIRARLENTRTITERGLSTEDNQLLNAAFKIHKEAPTDVIQTLFYGNRDDSRIENMIARTEIQRMLWNKQWNVNNVLIVNPSPMFLAEYSTAETKRYNYCHANAKQENRQKECSTTCVVLDDTLAELYKTQFPRYQFVSLSHLRELEPIFEYALVFARDYEKRDDLWIAFEKCKLYAEVCALIPQTAITQKDETLTEFLIQNQIGVQYLMDIPDKACKTAPQKKLLMTGQKRPTPTRKIRLLRAVTDETGEWLVLRKDNYTVPAYILQERMTFSQMLMVAMGKNQPVPRIHGNYQFSKEIPIEYSKIMKKGVLIGIKASYREKDRLNKNRRIRKGKRIVQNVEKGLRGSSLEEILPKIESVITTPQFSESIAKDLRDYYRDDPGVMSLKSLWICCLETLTKYTKSYDHSIAMELFCGPNQVLSDLISGTCTHEDILKAMNTLYGDLDIPKKKWLQVNLIFRTAVEEGLLEHNPMAVLIPSIKSKPKERLYLLNSLFKKSFFTEAEEERMIRFLRELIPIPGKRKAMAPRYIVESKWLSGAACWFTGLKLKDICPLTWSDLCEIDKDITESYFRITKFLTPGGKVLSYGNEKTRKNYRKIAVAMILLDMLMERKQYLKDRYGYTDEVLADMPIFLEEEPFRSRGKKVGQMMSLSTAGKVRKQLIQEAKIPEDILTLLEGEERKTIDFSEYRYDLFEANFRHKAYHYCGFTEGELCYHLGNKGPDTFTEHYCDYGEDWILYNMVRKLYRWTGNFDLSRAESTPVLKTAVLKEDAAFMADRFANGRTSASLSLMYGSDAQGSILVELEAEHGLDGIAVSYMVED